MELGLLILRCLLALLLMGHALQKLLGWFHGGGLAKTGELFDVWGHSPGRVMAAVAAVCELSAAALLAAGFLMPLAAAIVGGTMFVAGSVLFSKGLWAVRGGYELPLVYGVVALALAFTGAGRWSIDHAVVDSPPSGPMWGAASVALAVLAGAGPIVRAQLNRRRAEQRHEAAN